MGYLPSSLPPVDSVVVVDLRNVDANRVNQHMNVAADARSFVLSERDARRAVELWRQLPSSVQARCHIPPFGLRFISRGELVLQASICWKCCNIYGTERGKEIHYEFDADAPVAKELLEVCRNTVGSEQPT